jgi:hypothetical protein
VKSERAYTALSGSEPVTTGWGSVCCGLWEGGCWGPDMVRFRLVYDEWLVWGFAK